MGLKKNNRLEALRNSSIEKFGKGGFFIFSEGIHNKAAGILVMKDMDHILTNTSHVIQNSG